MLIKAANHTIPLPPQASSRDLAEADAAMKKLGLTKVNLTPRLKFSPHTDLSLRTMQSGRRSLRGS